MTDVARLRWTAENAKTGHGYHNRVDAYREFQDAIEPGTILKLLDVVDAAQRWHDDPTVRAHDVLREALAALSESGVSA